jgi:hypothetical protein
MRAMGRAEELDDDYLMWQGFGVENRDSYEIQLCFKISVLFPKAPYERDDNDEEKLFGSARGNPSSFCSFLFFSFLFLY